MKEENSDSAFIGCGAIVFAVLGFIGSVIWIIDKLKELF